MQEFNKISWNITKRDWCGLAMAIILGIFSGYAIIKDPFGVLIIGAFFSVFSPLIVSLVSKNAAMFFSVIPNTLMITITSIYLTFTPFSNLETCIGNILIWGTALALPALTISSLVFITRLVLQSRRNAKTFK